MSKKKDECVPLAVQTLRNGDFVDGKRCKILKKQPGAEFEYFVVNNLEYESADCVRVDFDQASVGYGPSDTLYVVPVKPTFDIRVSESGTRIVELRSSTYYVDYPLVGQIIADVAIAHHGSAIREATVDFVLQAIRHFVETPEGMKAWTKVRTSI